MRTGPKLTCWGKNDSGEAPQISITPLSITEIPALTYWEHGFYPLGGQKPYMAYVSTGILPEGIKLGTFLSPAGVILYGTPEIPAIYPFAITWEDAAPIPLVSEHPFILTVTGADLQIDIQPANPTTALYFNPFTFQYKITNQTALDVPDVLLNISLPAGLSGISISGLPGCAQVGLTLDCSLSSIAARAVHTLTVSGLVTAPAGQVMTTTAEIEPQLVNWPEVSPADNRDHASITVAEQLQVFNDPFTTAPPDTRWSAGDVITAPTGITYLGGFSSSDQLRLILNDLPPHRRAIVSFDLYVIGAWQANTAPPGLWEFGIWGQPAQLSTTFCNQEACQQAYPENYPQGSFPWRTSADGLDELGFSGIVDTRYHLSFNLMHSGAGLDLHFRSLDLPPGAIWGLDNVQVTLDWSAYSVHLPVIFDTR